MCAALGRLRDAAWIFGGAADGPLVWGREQALALAEKLCGAPARETTVPAAPFSIAVGTPDTHPLIRQAIAQSSITLDTLGPDDSRIATVRLDGQPVLVITGRNERAALYGLFACFETLGCRFLLSRDVLPDPDPDLMVPSLDRAIRTACTWRGVWLQFCFVGNSILSLADYGRLFDQMAKLRMNRVLYYHFENEPFLDYTYRGERKVVGDVSYPDSACMSLGRQDAGTFRTADLAVGRERFDRERVAPLEFQQVRTSAEALDTGRAFMQELIRQARRRGLGTWISFDPTFVSLNLAKYTRRMARPIELYCALTSFSDPVVSAINRSRIEFIVNAYPDIEGLLFQITEGAYEDPYPDSQAVLDREWPNYGEAFELLKRHWGKWWVGEDVQRLYMRADIGFVERLKQSMAAARELKPELRLGVLTVCKAYLLTYLDRILPKEMPFVDIESQSLWTVDGAPLHLFQRMQNRECVLVPRAYDDGSLAGLQFNLNLYQRDGFLESPEQNGTNGLAIQLTHLTGNDHNVRFLADGMWNGTNVPDDFYRDYAARLFGADAAAPMVEGFRLLEANEAFLGGRGLKNMPYSLNPPEIGIIGAAKTHSTPFFNAPWSADTLAPFAARTGKFQQAMQNLEQALGRFEAARPACRAAGRSDLEFLIGKTRAYRSHLQTLCLLPDVYGFAVQAFSRRDPQGPDACRDGLRDACRAAGRAEEQALETAREFTRCAAHPTDLAVVWMMNHVVIATRVLRQYLQNVLAYYEGREYWDKVDWELLSGASPFPAYHVAGQNTLILG